MKKIGLVILTVITICHFAQAQNLDSALKDYYVQCDKILAVQCLDLMQKGLTEIQESLTLENSGEIENKYSIEFWFESGFNEPAMDQFIETILDKYDMYYEKFEDAYSKMVDEISQPVPLETNDKFYIEKLYMKTLKSYLANKDGKLRIVFDKYRNSIINDLLPKAKELSKRDKRTAIMICQYICDRYRQVVQYVIGECLTYQSYAENIRLNRTFEGWK